MLLVFAGIASLEGYKQVPIFAGKFILPLSLLLIIIWNYVSYQNQDKHGQG